MSQAIGDSAASQRPVSMQETQRFLQSTLDALTAHIAVLDATGDIIAVNAAWRRFAEENNGTTVAHGVGVNYLDVCRRAAQNGGEEAAAMAQAIRDILSGQRQTFSLEYSCHSPEEERWFHVNVSRFENLGATFVVVSHENITKRKESEVELTRLHQEMELRVNERTAEFEQANASLQTEVAEREEAEAENRARARQQEAVAELGRRALSDISMDALFEVATSLVASTLDVELSTILEVLPGTDDLRVRSTTGWKTELAGRFVRGKTESQAGYALQTGKPVIVTDLRSETRFTPAPLLLASGIVSGVLVLIDGYGQPFGTLGAHTTRHRLFTQEDVNFLQSISNVLAAALDRHHIETEIRQLNNRLQNTNEQLRIENIDRQMALGALREVTQGIEEAREEAVKAREEAEIARETAELANRAKSQFLSRMSHELRTPMNAILGFGQLMEMGDLNTDDRESVAHILDAGRHLLELINEVLDISRIEAGHMALSPQAVRISDAIVDALDLVRPSTKQDEIRLINNVEADNDWYIWADSQRLKQVLLNLLSNAVKYNRKSGDVCVSAEVFAASATGTDEETDQTQIVRLSIRDCGHGLSETEMNKLFVPFERLGAADMGIEGTGIGLALSKQLVEVMGGKLGAESTVGEGSTFWIEFPLAAAPADDLDYLDLALPGQKVAEDRSTVLYIEDNLMNLALVKQILGNDPSISFQSALRGSIGLDMAHLHQPDLILLDLNLPDIQGDEVLERLRASTVTHDIPVIVVSADATSKQRDRLLEAGARAYVTKPLDVSLFLKTVGEVLNGDKE